MPWLKIFAHTLKKLRSLRCALRKIPPVLHLRKLTLKPFAIWCWRKNDRRSEHEKKLFVMYDQMYQHLTYGKIEHYNPVSLRSEMRHYTIFIDAISKVSLPRSQGRLEFWDQLLF
jgi:aspartate aminotransferase